MFTRIIKERIILLTSLQKLKTVIDDRVDEFGAQYVAFAIFCCLNHPIYYLTWRYLDEQSYESLFLRTMATLICIPLLFAHSWPKAMKSWLPVYWYFAITFNLPFFFVFMLLMNNASSVWLMSNTVILFWVLFLVDWASYLSIMAIGIVGAWLTFVLIKPPHFYELNYVGLITQYVGSVIVIVLFARKKIKFDREKFMSMRIFGDYLSHEVSTPLLAITSGIAGLKNYLTSIVTVLQNEQISLPGLPQPKTLQRIPIILENIEKESEHIANFIEVINSKVLHKKHPDLLKNTLDIHDCLNEVLQHCIYLTSSKIEIDVEPNIHFFFIGDDILIKNIINNLLKNAVYSIRKARKGKLSIFATETKQYNQLHIKDTGLGINKNVQKKLFEPFYSTKEEGEGAGIGLTFCKIAMTSMDGNILLKAEAHQYAEFILQFPKIPLREN